MVIPKPIRDALDIRPGTALSVEIIGEQSFQVTINRVSRREALDRAAGLLAHRRRPLSPEQEVAAIERDLLADDERIKRRYRRR